MNKEKMGDPPHVIFSGSAQIAELRVGSQGGIEIDFQSTTTDGRALDGSTAGFDPWQASLDQALALGMHSAAFGQFAAVQVITQDRKVIECGGLPLLNAIAVCARHGLVIPDWLGSAFIERLLRVQRHEEPDLGAAFGVTALSSRKAQSLRRRKQLLPLISKMLVKALVLDVNRPIDKGLFEEVGQALNVGATDCERLYREGLLDGMQDLKELKKFLKAGKKSRRNG